MLALLLATTIAAPAGDVSYRQPHVAVHGGRVVVAFGAKNTVYVAVSNDGGVKFAKPVAVPESGVLALGMHRGPRVAVAGGAIVVSAIAGAKGRGQDGDLLAWRSLDGGGTWSRAVKINDVAGSAREGLHAMASSGESVVFAAWLDLRSKGTRINGSVSEDGGATWGRNVMVYESPSGSVCECCHPSAAVAPNGEILVMFRNSIEGSRDMYVVRSSDRGKTFGTAAKQGSGTWKLNACPMDGGGIAAGVSAWRREKDVYVANGSGGETLLGQGRDPAIAVGEAGPYVLWSSAEGLRLARPDGTQRVLDPKGRYASAASSGTVVAVWERDGAIIFDRLD